MALESAVNFKAAIATAAADLTTALQDTVLTALANEVKDPRQALRQIEKLFTLNPATGVFTSDDAYIDAAYAGNPLNKGKTPIGVGGIGPVAVGTLTTAAIADGASQDIVLTFSERILSVDGLVLGGDASPAREISSFVIADNVVTVTVGLGYIGGNTVTISGNFHPQGLQGPIVLAAEAVTNNVVSPTLSTATVENAAPADIVLTYGVAIDDTSIPAVGDYIPSLSKVVSAVVVATPVVTITVTVPFINGNVITIDYVAGLNPIQDAAGDPAANLTAQAVTNNVV